MKSGITKRLAMVAAAGLAGFLTACGSGPEPMEHADVDSNAEDYVSRMNGDTAPEAPAEGPREARQPSPRASQPRPALDAEGELEKLAVYYANQAAREYSEGRYERALEYARDALTMNPANALANQVKADAEQILARGRSSSENIARARSQEEAAKRSEAIYEINSGLETASRLMRERRFTEAIAEIERVLDIIRWTSYMVETEGPEREARLLLQEAQTKQEQARLEGYARVREDERRIRELEIQEEMNRYREEIRNYFTQAREYFDRREYRAAIVVLNKILREDPYNAEVAKLKSIATSLESGQRDRTAWEEYNRNWRETMQVILRTNAMPVRDVNLSSYEDWQSAIKRADRLESEYRTQLSREDITVRSALENVNVALEYDGANLSDVVARFRAEGRINIVLSSSVRNEDPEVNVEIGRVTLRQALELLCSQLELSWRVENGAVIISEQGAADGSAAFYRMFPVADLLIGYRTFVGDEPRLSADDRASDPRFAEEELEMEAEQVSMDDLMEVIEFAIDADSWGEPGHSIQYQQQNLIVRNTAENIERVAGLLQDLRRSQGLTVSVEARFITIRDDFLEDIGVDFRGIGGAPQIPPPGIPPVPAALDDIQFGNPNNPAGPGGTGNSAGFFFQDMPPSGNVRMDQRVRIENLFDQALGGRRGNVGLLPSGGMSFQLAFVDNPEVNAIIRAVRKRERATLLTAPRLTVHNTQRAHLSVMNEIAYIRDFDTNVATGVAVADPVVDVIRDGIVLDVRPTISSDRRYITLELRPTLATLIRPIPTFTTSLGVGTPVAIQTPQLTLQRMRTTVTIPDGGSFVIGGLRQMTEVDIASGIPIISDLPLIGALFTRKGKSVVRQDIIIVVSARIIDLEEEEEYEYGAGPSRPR